MYVLITIQFEWICLDKIKDFCCCINQKIFYSDTKILSRQKVNFHHWLFEKIFNETAELINKLFYNVTKGVLKSIIL